MKTKEKTIHQLKKEVLIAYLSQQTPGITSEAKKHWMEKYEKARKQLEVQISMELNM